MQSRMKEESIATASLDECHGKQEDMFHSGASWEQPGERTNGDQAAVVQQGSEHEHQHRHVEE